MSKRLLIYDPVSYFGGSKQVALNIVSQLPSTVEVWVATNDVTTWQSDQVSLFQLWVPTCLQDQTTGVGYYLKHVFYMLSLLYLTVTKGRFNRCLGISGPTVDFALYLYQILFFTPIVQLVQGPVPCSRIAGYGLSKAKHIFCLTSMFDSVQQALWQYLEQKDANECSISHFVNAVDVDAIAPHEPSGNVEILWCASLLHWKRLDLFLEAIERINQSNLIPAVRINICYIKPQHDALCYQIPHSLPDNVCCIEQPHDLAAIRARSSIFVSTAEQEPFGLSILEAMAANLSVVIPDDGAYWDQQLTHGKDCTKYTANDVDSLALVLKRLILNADARMTTATNAQQHARLYSSQKCYSQIKNSLF